MTLQFTTQFSAEQDMHANLDARAYALTALTVDIVVFTCCGNTLQVLLIQRSQEPFEGRWALPGGFVNIDEGLEDAAARELEEETNVQSRALNLYLEQLYTFGAPDRDPRGRTLSVAHFALMNQEQVEQTELRSRTDAEATNAGWFDAYDLPPLAFDHDEILAYAVQRLRWKLEWTLLGLKLLPREFTLSDLQCLYEAVLDEPLDKRNFRRKMLAVESAGTRALRPTGNYRQGDHRPARLYSAGTDSILIEGARRRFP